MARVLRDHPAFGEVAMGTRALAVVVLLFALMPALPAGAENKAAPSHSNCTQHCDPFFGHELQDLDLKPIEQLAGGGAAIVRVVAESEPRNSLVVDITHFSPDHSVLVVRSLRKVGVLPRLVERTVDLPEARWGEVLVRAREVLALAEQIRSKKSEASCVLSSSAHVAVARDRELSTASACWPDDGIREFAGWLSKQVASWLPGCERLAGPSDGTGEVLDQCLMLEGDRALAAELVNLVSGKDFVDEEFSFAAPERQRRFAFTDDCWVYWPNLDKEVSGQAACQKALDKHGHPDLEFDGFYGLQARREKRVEVWATGTATYSVDAYLQDGSQVLGMQRAPFSISWRRGEDGQWRIAHWEIGAPSASGPEE
jgi:ketosteroid isomerase-like protein